MHISVYEDYESLSKETSRLISEFVRRKPEALLCFPAGNSPEGTFKYLIESSGKSNVDFSRCKFVGLDEWVGLSREDDGSCKKFVYDNFFVPMRIKEENICFFDACADDLNSQCKKVDEFIFENGGIDLMLVGVGMNGHIALNEPGTTFDQYSHVVELDSVTKKVGRKYFRKPVKLDKGITLGMKHFLEAGKVIFIADGIRKSGIVKKVVEGEITNAVPASLIKSHADGYLLLDRDAASMLDSSQVNHIGEYEHNGQNR